MNPDIRLIAAVGRHGQLGFAGRLAWQEPDDLRWFREQTWGHVVVMGERTYREIDSGLPGRTVYLLQRRHRLWLDRGGFNPPMIISQFANRVIFIAGGATIYKLWLDWLGAHRVPFRAVLTRIDYDGPSDVWMPPLWEARP